MTDALVGKKLPSLQLKATDVGQVTLPGDILGAWTLIYFYPKDDTPGCTKQACAYRDDAARFTQIGVKLFGVSLDELDSHAAFQKKYALNFPLLSDPDHRLADFFGVYGAREWQGKKFMGLSRDTFLIDPDGHVAQVWRGVDPLTTAQQTYAAVSALVGQS